MRTSIATVCLSGGLVEKLHACAKAGFDGVEIMDTDLTSAFESPEEIRALAQRLGLTLDMFQPLRDIEGVTEEVFQENLLRAERKFEVMQRLGTDLVLLCSNVGTATVNDEDVFVDQLQRLSDLAARYGVRIAYEALAWGRYVDDYRVAARIMTRVDRENFGTCLDSFHILSRGHDPAGIEEIPGEKIFFLQLADAPELDMDVLSWSRHHRLFPGEGDFDLTGFLGHVLRAGYRGPLSLEVFNDTFRQTDVTLTAAHARRSLAWLTDSIANTQVGRDANIEPLPAPQSAREIDFVEIGGSDLNDFDQLLSRLGFDFRGRHHTKPVRLWTAGSARIVLNEQLREETPRLSAIGLRVDHAALAAERAVELGAETVYRRTYTGEVELPAVAAPDGTEVYWNDRPAEESWVLEFQGGSQVEHFVGEVDHVNMSYAWKDFNAAVLFLTSVVGLESETPADVPSLRGLVRSQVMRSADNIVRLPMNLAPPTAPLPDRHIAVRVDDVVSVARAARERGLDFLPIPGNYYDDLAARFNLPDDEVQELRDLSLLYDRDASGEFIHFYTPTVGGVFLELVERRRNYEGYGAMNAPVRLASQR